VGARVERPHRGPPPPAADVVSTGTTRLLNAVALTGVGPAFNSSPFCRSPTTPGAAFLTSPKAPGSDNITYMSGATGADQAPPEVEISGRFEFGPGRAGAGITHSVVGRAWVMPELTELPTLAGRDGAIHGPTGQMGATEAFVDRPPTSPPFAAETLPRNPNPTQAPVLLAHRPAKRSRWRRSPRIITDVGRGAAVRAPGPRFRGLDRRKGAVGCRLRPPPTIAVLSCCAGADRRPIIKRPTARPPKPGHRRRSPADQPNGCGEFAQAQRPTLWGHKGAG